MMHRSSLVSHSMMENDIFNVSLDIADQNHMVIDGVTPHMFSTALVQPDSLDLNSQSQLMIGYPLLSPLQGEPINDLHISNHVGVVDADASVSTNTRLSRHAVQDASVSSSHSICNPEFGEHSMGEANVSAKLLATRSGLHENLNAFTISATSALPLEDLSTFVSNDCCNTSTSSLTASVNYGYDGPLDNMEFLTSKKDTSITGQLDGKWDFDKILAPEVLARETPIRTACQPDHFIGSADPTGWILSNKPNLISHHPYGFSMPSNELSLSLATCQPSIISVRTIPDQCSEISFSGVTHHSLHKMGSALEQTSSNSNELSLGFGSYRPVHFSQILSGSRYLSVAQEILAEIASYSLENLDQLSYLYGGTGTRAKVPFTPSCYSGTPVMESDDFPSSAEDGRSKLQSKSTLQRQEVEAKKGQLFTLLQVVDSRYNQCLDEIHTVISAFHAATELDPRVHAHFALQTISVLYKNLRERISNQILATGGHISSESMREEGSFESSFIQKQWALQQLRRKDHHSWRPERGLPERSVSVLRAWMFQNFLHPYPKDAEKHLLAIKSGLTRSQVSNWFINARVRLWKPLIEEMHSEMNNRKACRTDEGTDINCRSHISIDDQIIRMD
ncbi:hypothetical protein HHK36_025522 [Tetracentron sinense]|uniref:Homeobox domain-containing protein n=1 Tax=Tetracentron sinense TaxID=13715 RepID=A0A834YHR0_TETSI|nr:hypothetical protein HHK36_025522 [Tetracentron sinense]